MSHKKVVDLLLQEKIKRKRMGAHLPGKDPAYCFQKVAKRRTLKDKSIQVYYYWELRRNWRDPENWEKMHSSVEKHLGPAQSHEKHPPLKQEQEAAAHLNAKYGRKFTIESLIDTIKKELK